MSQKRQQRRLVRRPIGDIIVGGLPVLRDDCDQIEDAPPRQEPGFTQVVAACQAGRR